MRKYAIVLGLILSFAATGQNDSIKAMDEEKMERAMKMMLTVHNIKMDVDSEIYPISDGNNYFTSDQRAGIAASVIPSSYEKMKTDMDNQKSEDGSEILDKGEIENNGNQILYLKQKLTRGEEIFIMHMYCKKIDDESCLTIGGFFENGKEDIYSDDIKKAAISAEIIK